MPATRIVEGRSVTVAVSSITLDVEVWVLREGRGERVKVTEAEFTFVALDEAGRPRPIQRAGN